MSKNSLLGELYRTDNNQLISTVECIRIPQDNSNKTGLLHVTAQHQSIDAQMLETDEYTLQLSQEQAISIRVIAIIITYEELKLPFKRHSEFSRFSRDRENREM